MKKDVPYKFDSLSDLHRVLGLPKPMHPLISLINTAHHSVAVDRLPRTHILNFYKIAYQPDLQGTFRYGQHRYDFDEGGLFFVSPNQLLAGSETSGNQTGYVLFIHPDFLLTYPLAQKIKQYGFFSYAVHEALHLSESEKRSILATFNLIEEELTSRIDTFSQDVLIAQLELLLGYAHRFYTRQFITRKAVSHDLLQKLDGLLADYLGNDDLVSQGIPTVQYLADCLRISPSYLSDMLRSLTGRNTQHYIHDTLIEQAKEKLATTRLSVSEVAYALGFEHPQSFSKLFKTKTALSPLAFRRSFN